MSKVVDLEGIGDADGVGNRFEYGLGNIIDSGGEISQLSTRSSDRFLTNSLSPLKKLCI